MNYLEFMFQSFWHFVGCFMVIGVPFKFILSMYIRTVRFFTIRKHGYPLGWVDADGDFKPTED